MGRGGGSQICSVTRQQTGDRVRAPERERRAENTSLPSQTKALQKLLFKKTCFGTINFVKITKQSLYKANSFTCSLLVAATLQRKCSGGIICVIITKIITKINVSRSYFVIISARMVDGRNAR